jgi:hypothetical protein
MNRKIQLRAGMPEPQAEIVLQGLSLLPFNIEYQKKQYGALAVSTIDCTVVQEKPVRDTYMSLVSR